MCTVTYLPQVGNSFILTSNRDEDVYREVALPVNKYTTDKNWIYYPKDQKAGGTWIASGSNGFTVCLLNGAFNAHQTTGNYKKSRGLVVLDFFNYTSQYDFINEYDFLGIEPFTLIFVKHHSETNIGLCELRWDGVKTHHSNYDASLPHIWSSVTLYSNDVIQQRQTWFNTWVNNNVFTKESILMFHNLGGNGDKENDLIINRNQKKTVSICCIQRFNANETDITYVDVVNTKLYTAKILAT